MSKQTLVFNDIEVNKKDFYASKQAIPLNLVDVNNIVISNRVNQNNDICEYFIGYLNNESVVPLPQMSGCIEYFENGERSMSLKIEDEDVYLKYNEIWNKIKSILNVEFHSQPIYDDKYIKTKVKTFNSMINTLFSGDEIPKERNHYVCISAICINSVLRLGKKKYPQAYFQQCKHKIKKERISKFY